MSSKKHQKEYDNRVEAIADLKTGPKPTDPLVEELESHDNIEAVELRRGQEYDRVVVVFKPNHIFSTDFAQQYGFHLREVWVTLEQYRLREYLVPKERLVARFILNRRGLDDD